MLMVTLQSSIGIVDNYPFSLDESDTALEEEMATHSSVLA